MAQHVSLEGIAENAWDNDLRFTDKLISFGRECMDNFPFEWKCISMCEFGDVLGTYAAATTSAYDYSNEIGFLSGIGFGLGYAYNHTSKDAKKHGVRPSFKDSAMAAGTAETGCVTAATLVAYYFGSKYGIDFSDPVIIKEVMENWKLYAQDLGVRLSALLPALPIGLAAMSSFTFPKKSEAGRLVTNKGKLYDTADFLRNHHPVHDNRDRLRGFSTPTAIVYGMKSHVKIKEEKLPEVYHKDFDPDAFSLYRVFTPEAKYSRQAGKSAEALVCSVFNGMGLENHAHVINPFAHSHAH